MEIKDKVYEVLVGNKFFNTEDAVTIIIRTSKLLKISERKVIDAIKQLSQEKRVIAQGKIVKDCGQLKTGVFHEPKKGNYGFVTVEGIARDLFVLDKKDAMEGDIVEVGVYSDRGKECAFINKIVERKEQIIIGVIEKAENGRCVFRPDDKKFPDFIVPDDQKSKDCIGKKCSIKVLMSNIGSSKVGYGTIDKVFGFADDPITENVAIAYKYGFVKDFPSQVNAEVTRCPQKVSDEELKDRHNFTHLDFMPWDPEGCKDKDDAMYVEKTKTGYRAYVAIADVEHYVKTNTEIDKEAYKRGTSCYLGDGVYPMLPPELSNGICSLNDGEIRLTHCAIVDIDEKGEVQKFDFVKAYIKIKKAYSYEEAEKVHLCREGYDQKYKDQKQQIDLLYKVAEILREKLINRGYMSFDNKEPTFKFDITKRKVIDILDTSDVTSHFVVEMLMILANEAAAQFLLKNCLPGIFRIHEKPDQQRVDEVNKVLRALKIDFTLQPNCKSYQKLTKLIENSKYKEFLTGIILCSLTKARYDILNLLHFGLASSGYTHFTSPIRRYPDLLVHRIIAEYVKNKKIVINKKVLEEKAIYLSDREKKAEAAEVLSDKLLYSMWASNHIGETMKGYISSISKGSVTVRVGLVEMTMPLFDLYNGANSDYRLSADRLTLEDRYSKKKYSLADELEFKVYKVDVKEKVIYATTDLQKEIVLDTEEEMDNNIPQKQGNNQKSYGKNNDRQY